MLPRKPLSAPGKCRFRLEHDAAFFHGDPLPPFLCGVKRGGAFRLGVVAGKENILAGVADGAAAVQGENDHALAVDTAFHFAKLRTFGAGLGGELLHAEKGL